MVGDLHGHRALLELELDRLAFDPTRDRLFSVGDLIDRGPDSLGTLSLIEEPWFHAVLGNHEIALLGLLGLRGDGTSHKAAATGADWISNALSKHRKRALKLAERLLQLPLAIHVDDAVPFNVMHSDLHPIGTGQDVLEFAEHISLQKATLATCSRANVAEASKSSMLRLSFAEHAVDISEVPMGVLPITYVGHCPVRQIVVHNSYVHIDQGVCLRSKTPEPRPPTVLSHAAFAHWLHGASTARSTRASAPAAEDRRVAFA